MDSGYIRVNTFPFSVSTCLQTEGRVSSSLSLFILVFARIMTRLSRAQIITIAEGQGTGCLICIGSQHSQNDVALNGNLCLAAKKQLYLFSAAKK